ncbi:dextranase [Alloscardovia theropitheci]|uniref:Dextranase n=1 Tax=Alloscardovia theropitheci TaxID=2496842 RepID=A0A4R0QVV8_9BIFI|nr:glucodextranase DOMON-like domain-containing protein [Alloscardovia theropitheci]TCD54417.1 dextranase [Alloscardovia theropitheci]
MTHISDDSIVRKKEKRKIILIVLAAVVAVAILAGTAIWGISAINSTNDSASTSADGTVTSTTQYQSSSAVQNNQSTHDNSSPTNTEHTDPVPSSPQADSAQDSSSADATQSEKSQGSGSSNRSNNSNSSADTSGSNSDRSHHSQTQGDTSNHSDSSSSHTSSDSDKSQPEKHEQQSQDPKTDDEKTDSAASTSPADPVVWNYGSHAVKDAQNTLADDQVRQSPFYSVQVRNDASTDDKTKTPQSFDSFTYLSIPRGGLGKVGYTSDDGAEFAADNGFTMSWSSFVYSHDVWVNVSLDTGAKISSVDDVTIRPTTLNFQKKLVNDHTIAIKIPFSADGYRFSVEFAPEQTDVYANGAGGAVTKYSTASNKDEQLANAHDYIETEPRNSMMIFAQPEVKGTEEGAKTIPTETSGKTLTVEPGEFPKTIADDIEIIYLKAGVHWMGAKRQAEFPASVRWVYFEPGAYLKGALKFEGNRDVTNYKITGYGVLSTEQYGYETSTTHGFTHRPDSDNNCWDSCVKPMRFSSENVPQKLDLQGITVKEPSYHSFVQYGYDDFALDVRNYQQVGAWYWQTDGLELYKGSTMKNTFIHANDDAVKLYHDDVTAKNTVIWKNENGPVFQWGWVGRNINNVRVENTDIIHNRMYWGGNSNSGVFNSAGDLWGGSHEESPSPNWLVQNMTFKNTRVEGALNCGINIDNQGSAKNITIDGFYVDKWNGQSKDLQRSRLTMASNRFGQKGQFGDEHSNGLTIRNYFVGGQGISLDDGNWQADQLGRLNFDASLWGKWSVDYDKSVATKPTVEVSGLGDGQVVDSRNVTIQGTVSGARNVTVIVNGEAIPAVIADGKFSARVHFARTNNSVRVVATNVLGENAQKVLTLVSYGEKLGSMTDREGDDNGPGSYEYPLDSAFTKGNFDMTEFTAYADGDHYDFTTTMATDITNPWNGNGISTQQLNIYLRDGEAVDTGIVPLREGTQSYVQGAWNYVIVVDGRFNPGVYDAQGKKIGDIEIAVQGKRLTARVAKTVLGKFDVKDAKYQVSMYSSVESDAGLGNIRPIFSAECVAGRAEGCDNGWLKYYRFCGAKGNYLHDNPYNTDHTASNALDIFVGNEKRNGTQAEIMSLDHDKVLFPYLKLER